MFLLLCLIYPVYQNVGCTRYVPSVFECLYIYYIYIRYCLYLFVEYLNYGRCIYNTCLCRFFIVVISCIIRVPMVVTFSFHKGFTCVHIILYVLIYISITWYLIVDISISVFVLFWYLFIFLYTYKVIYDHYSFFS